MIMLSIVRAARALISEEKHWTQDELACNSEGLWVSPFSPDAVKWCSIGALQRVSKGNDLLRYRVYSLFGGRNALQDFNDLHTHAEVLAHFDVVISRLETQP